MVGLKRRAGEGRKGRSELLVDQLGLGRIGSDRMGSSVFPPMQQETCLNFLNLKYSLKKKIT